MERRFYDRTLTASRLGAEIGPRVQDGEQVSRAFQDLSAATDAWMERVRLLRRSLQLGAVGRAGEVDLDLVAELRQLGYVAP